MKREPEMVEGPEAFKRFEGAMKKVLTVSPGELKQRIEAENKKAAMNPRKRGSKPGVLNHKPRAAKPRRASSDHAEKS